MLDMPLITFLPGMELSISFSSTGSFRRFCLLECSTVGDTASTYLFLGERLIPSLYWQYQPVPLLSLWRTSTILPQSTMSQYSLPLVFLMGLQGFRTSLRTYYLDKRSRLLCLWGPAKPFCSRFLSTCSVFGQLLMSFFHSICWLCLKAPFKSSETLDSFIEETIRRIWEVF